jgi:outer membrane receptor for ferrienterochelin and colicins
MQTKTIYTLLITLLTIYSSNAFSGSCGSVYDEELGWLQEVEVASGQAEPLSDVPAPVTIINSDMITNIGARTVKDVLITYVPGMTDVQNQCYSDVAERGIYSVSQQKILVLLNGHRLNSHASSVGYLDFSMSVDKLACIEVLRAPGSSLYGNVALTAVVNLVTKKGTDINGTEVSVGVGNYGQRKVNFLFGNEFENGKSDLLLWGSYYTSEGETVSISKEDDYSREPKDSYAIVDGVNAPGAYDIGLTYEFGDFTLLANQRRTRYISPFTQMFQSGDLFKGGGEPYNYSDYTSLNGIAPGQSSSISHLGMDYVNQFDNNLKLQVQVYYDEFENNRFLINNQITKDTTFFSYNERGYGFISQLSKPYNFFGAGTWMIGSQINTMELYDSNLIYGKGDQWLNFLPKNNEKEVFDTGTETITSIFTQIKHNITDTLLGNFGVRFDKKDRHQGDSIDEMSPRLALIWKPYDKFNLKISYSKAFVDAPYVFRYYNYYPYPNNPFTLQPEYMESYQVTPTFKFAQGKITSSFNVFYNNISNVIWRNPQPEKEQNTIQNYGFLNQWGIENETTYNQNAYNLAFNLTYQAADGAENYAVSDDKIWNVPNWTANFILNVNPFELFNFHHEIISQDLWLNLTARYIGEQLSPINIAFPNGTSFYEPNNQVEDVVLFNTGFRWNKLWRDFFLDARVYNLLDEDYYQGGSVTHPYPQAGRWFMVTVGYKGNW